MEALLPFAVALTVVTFGMGLWTTQLEAYGLLSHIMWFEVGSHCGKPLPTLTTLPPLSPLLRLAVGDFDDRNVSVTVTSFVNTVTRGE
jgi:hypothetical protein